MAGTPKWHKYNFEVKINASNHRKLKNYGKKYARPLILTKNEWAQMFYFDMRRLNPEFRDKTDKEISEWWDQ